MLLPTSIRLMIAAASASSFLRVADPAREPLLVGLTFAADERHHRHAGLEARQAEREPGKHDQRRHERHQVVRLLAAASRSRQ